METTAIGKEHYSNISRIYKEGIETGYDTFETTAPEWEDWDKSKLKNSRLAVVVDGIIVGWAALSAVSDRCVYGGVTEVSMYVSNSHKGKGVGKTLMARLIEESEAYGIWTLQSGMFLENEATVALHQRFGFRTVGFREKIGKLGDTWRDTIIMKRRSKTIGIN